MAKNLVIIESPGKIKKIKEILGSGYEIMSSYGHIFDLPKKKISVDVKKDFAYVMEVLDDKKDVLKNITSAAKKSDNIYLMTDVDREGSGIAHNLKQALEEAKVKGKILRAETTEITKSGVSNAIKNAGDINLQMVNAYLCRRLLDRLVGFKCSFLTQQATGGKSAGRVQSAMLRILVEREKEIQSFVPEEYWDITAEFQHKKDTYSGMLDEKIKVPNEEAATIIYDAVMKGKPEVVSVETQKASVDPYAPFTTSTLIQSGSTLFGWPADKTMKVAQTLYETGRITYMRTDSPYMAPEALSAMRGFIDHTYGANYLHSTVKYYAAKKGAQEGHECCRPTDFTVQKTNLSVDENKLYEMVWKRAVASQMVSGEDERTKVVTRSASYDFISRGNRILFDGFRKVWTYSKQGDNLLPILKQGDKPTLLNLDKEQKFTTPPPRYSDASLQKKCDQAQITRPATFASFLKTLQSRGYINRVKKSFEATELGIRVVDFLVAAKMCFVDYDFTADLENKLDQIANGKEEKLAVLKNFWTTLQADIANANKVKENLSLTKFVCPKCSALLKLKHSKFGSFFSCSNYKKQKDGDKKNDGCSYIATVGEHGEPIEKVVKPKEYLDFPCEKCGKKMVKRTGKFGEFGGCSGFPSCRSVSDLDGTFKKNDGKKKFKKFKKKASSEED
jgi:DNA topoisomerase I